jgi:PAS domain S-box-containing protein
VREGFVQGGVPAELVDGMYSLFRRFRRVGFVDRSIAIWAEADRRIEELQRLAAELRGEMETGRSRARVDELLGRIDLVDARLTRLEEDFSATFNGGALRVERALRLILVAIAATLLGSGVLGGVFVWRQVRARESELARSEARYRGLFEQNVVGAALVDPGGAFLEVNRAFASIFGWDDPAELVGRNAADLYAEPSQRDPIMARLRGGGSLVTHELDCRRRNGEIVPVMVGSVLLREPDTGTERVLATVLDLTHRRELEEELVRARRMEAMGQLAGGIAHDFNNLLTVIRGNAQLLEEELARESPAGDAGALVGEILRGADSAASLTSQLLEFSRGQAPDTDVVDPNHLARELREHLRRLLPPGIALELHLRPGLPSVAIASARLEQVLVNLVVNAREAMPSGGRLVVSTDLVDPDSSGGPEARRLVRVRVQDTGEGMSAGVRERIFEPFFSTKEGHASAGMGLATVYGIVTKAGGMVRVESEPGAGATFTVLLPAAETAPATPPPTPSAGDDPAPAPAPRDEPRAAGSTPDAIPRARIHRGATVLLVEDERMVRRLARRVLESGGYHVIECSDPADALTRLEGSDLHPDLLVTDIVMPGMNGVALAERFRALHPDVPVLYMSGYTDHALEPDEMRRPDTAFLEKPFRPEGLLSAAAALLARAG